MSWPDFQFQQDAIRERSAAPTLYSREYCDLNLLYGAAEVLRQFAGLPAGHPVPWAVQHLIKFDSNEADEQGTDAPRGLRNLRRSGIPWLLTITGQQARFLQRLGFTRCAPVGSVFLYARENYRRGFADRNVQRRGTIVFPDKSDLNKAVEYDRERFAEMLVRLPDVYQPVYVSMFWRDYERGNHEPYARAGLPLVCSGHSYDAKFYLRHYDICRRFKYACSNEISTSFCLSVLAGCRFFFLPAGPVSIQRDGTTTTYDRNPNLAQSGQQLCLAASPFPPKEDDGGLQANLAARLAGEQHLRAPEFFRELWEPACAALSELQPAAPLLMEAAPAHALFARWLPHGFDSDGWGDTCSGLEIPGREGFAGVEMQLDFPKAKASQDRLLTVRLDEDEAQVSQVTLGAGTLHLRIPQRPDGKRRRVDLTCSTDARLPGEVRRRALRLVAIHWQASFNEAGPATVVVGNRAGR